MFHHHQRRQYMPPAYESAVAAHPYDHAAEERSNILAERYKTKMCRNYTAAGHCPYESRCMFAHGDHELRTTEMNLDDGLVTEEAIRSFQRAMAGHRPEPPSPYRHDPYASCVLPAPLAAKGVAREAYEP